MLNTMGFHIIGTMRRIANNENRWNWPLGLPTGESNCDWPLASLLLVTWSNFISLSSWHETHLYPHDSLWLMKCEKWQVSPQVGILKEKFNLPFPSPFRTISNFPDDRNIICPGWEGIEQSSQVSWDVQEAHVCCAHLQQF